MAIKIFEHEVIAPVATPKRRRVDHLICRHCGSEDRIAAHYREYSYGSAHVANRDGELEDYDTYDSDGFEIQDYVCRDCDNSGNTLEEVILNEGERFNTMEDDDDHDENEEEEE